MDPIIQTRLEHIPGHLGFYYKDLTSGQIQSYNSQDCFQAASVIKLPILAAILLLDQEQPGLLEERLLVRDADKLPSCGALQHISGDNEYDVLTLCKLMITISDNTATNVLIRRFGMDRLNHCFCRLGLEHTRLYRLLFDAQAAQQGLENLFCPLELAGLLEQIYRRTCVSPQASQLMEEMLSLQQIKHKLRGKLPSSIRAAHKTGEDSGISNDVGIVFGPRPCILVFASNGTDVPAFEQFIRETSYHYVMERP